jgi:hypothetical protein
MLEAERFADEILRRQTADPLARFAWCPPQSALLRSTNRRVLLRTGNQFGKTTVGLAEVIYHCLGRHPHKTVRPPPVEWWVVTATWSQSVAIQSKLWELLPKDEIDPSTEYDPVRGLRGRHPTVRFKNGSLIRIKTGRQGGLALAGATLAGLLLDEPPSSARLYGELDRRLTRTGGRLLMCMTPVNADVEWLQNEVEREGGVIEDLHFTMRPENFIPEGWVEPLRTETGELMDAAWIADQRSSVLAWEAPVVLDGEWAFAQTGRVFTGFNPSLHVVPNLLRSEVAPIGKVKLCLGLDYGEDALRTAGVYVYVDDRGAHPRYYVVSEYLPEGATTEDMDARALISMLARRGDRWADVDYAHGDKKYHGRSTAKSNRSMLRAVAKALGLAGVPKPAIRSAKRGQGSGSGSRWGSVRLLHDAMIRPGHFYVDASCVKVIEGLLQWQGGEKEPVKDILDALRYAVRPWWYGGGERTRSRILRART